MRQERISLVTHQFDRCTFDKLLIVSIIYRRSTGKHHLIIFKTLCHLYHRWQIVFDFLQTASCQQSDNRAISVKIILLTEFRKILMIFRSELPYFLRGWIAYIVNRIAVFLFEERYLERQDRKEFGYIALDAADPPLLPCPYLRRYIIIGRDICILFQELSYLEIKSRIIYQYHHIRFPFHYIFLTSLHVRKDGTQMQQYRYKTHICQLLKMLDASATFSSHQIAAEETEFCKLVYFFQRAHQSAGMQISTSLAYYQVILHNSKFFNQS